MRLPTLGGDRSNVDEAEAIRMLHYAFDHGVNYADSAYGYHGGNSERVLGKALKGGYRDKVKVATKFPTRLLQGEDDFDRILDEQLARLQVDHIDRYLLHGLRAPRWELVQRYDVLSRAELAIADGRIGCLGFSFHDSFDVFKEILDSYDGWTFCQIQYNYMNEEYQAGTKGLEYAAAKGLAVVVMEPLLGGKLVDPPQPIQDLWDTSAKARTPADWALQWQWNKPEVSLVLSGMSAMEHVVQNVASAESSGVGTLTADELALIGQVRDRYEELCPVPCTGCGYCMPCPNGVDIPRSFSTFNTGAMYNSYDDARRRYRRVAEEARANACIQCRACEELCPQDIEVSAWMPVVHEVLGEGRPYEECQLPA
jgi:predicted aldo/keto reductase-like oxidoreductase